MPQVILTHDDGSTDTIDATVAHKDKREIGKMRKLTATVDRDAAQAASPVPKEDEMELVGYHTGRLVDIEKGGSTWTLIGYAFEFDAKFETPTAGGTLKSGTDNALITEFINDVSTWTVGSIATLTGSMDFVFNHAFPHEAVRRIEQNVPGELAFNADKSVDYVDRRGSDKIGSVTLSNAAGNLNGEIQIKDINRDLDATHVRLIGAHEGEAQIFANLVPDDDPESYDNRVDYTTSRWSPGDSRSWSRRSNKDIMSQSAMDEEAAALGEELKETYIEAAATVEGEDLALGDTVHVEKPDADLDRDMRIHRITTKGTGAKEVDEVLLSTRTVMRQDNAAQARDIARYNVAFQGSAVWGTPSGGYQAVTPSENYRLTFFYPDVNFEHTAELYVESRPYRTFHAGAASGGTTTSDSNTDPAKIGGSSETSDFTQAPTTWTTIAEWTSGLISSQAQIYAFVRLSGQQAGNGELFFRVIDNEHNEEIPDIDGISRFVSAAAADEELFEGTITFAIPGDFGNVTTTDSIDLQAKFEPAATDPMASLDVDASIVFWSTHTHSIDPHTHDVNPGVSAFPSITASSVDVIVNGTTTDTNIGSGSFTTAVDITGHLNKGQFNTIELASDSTGWLYAVAGLESYRQIGTN